MKKVILFGIALMSLFCAKAQQFTVGGGLAYGTEISQAGITLNGQYFFAEKFAIAPSFIFYVPEKNSYSGSGFSSEAKSSVWEFNADVNYYFYKNNVVSFFGEGGLNITSVRSKVKTTGTFTQKQTANNSEAGLNLGIGADFKAGETIVPFVSMKYVVSNFDEFVLRGGIRFLLK